MLKWILVSSKINFSGSKRIAMIKTEAKVVRRKRKIKSALVYVYKRVYQSLSKAFLWTVWSSLFSLDLANVITALNKFWKWIATKLGKIANQCAIYKHSKVFLLIKNMVVWKVLYKFIEVTLPENTSSKHLS